ncbi:hypothetical protein ACGFWD_26610 [Streptomyces sp. NPDC048448]|uniref:hypothetical protein n=1 Tax=unclassified Streptomyces TaxID=2593676 RepID=UPI003448ED1C
MPAHPGISRPDDAALNAAMERTLSVLAAVFHALGPGEHTLDIALLRTDDLPLCHGVEFPPGADVQLSGILGDDDYYTLAVYLVFALEGSTVTGATLIATTITEPCPRVCGWVVRDGWLHPMDTASLEVALIPCPGTEAEDRDVYTAPTLPEPSGMDEESTRG